MLVVVKVVNMPMWVTPVMVPLAAAILEHILVELLGVWRHVKHRLIIF